MIDKFFCGIGSRQTPPDICKQMTEIASVLEEKGYTLRSGNANGADQAFARGVKEKAEIWLPFAGFNEDFMDEYPNHDYKILSSFDEDAHNSVYKFHPNPKRLTERGFLLQARNHRQLFGENNIESKFIICWTKDGKATGGTGQNLRAAEFHEIPVFNMFYKLINKEHILRTIELMELFEE
jgi:hypothetical protein